MMTDKDVRKMGFYNVAAFRLFQGVMQSNLEGQISWVVKEMCNLQQERVVEKKKSKKKL